MRITKKVTKLNKQGSTLLLVMIVFVILSIFSVTAMSSMQNGVKQTVRQQHGAQASYMARAGVVAIEEMLVSLTDDELVLLYEDVISGDPIHVTITDLTFDSGEITDAYIQMVHEELNVKVTAKAGEISKEIVKVMGDGDEITTVKVPSVVFDMAVYSKDLINLSNGTIKGNLGTNGLLRITGNPSIEGTGYVMDMSKYTTPGTWWTKIDGVEIMDNEREFALPLFPEFPQLAPRSNITTAWNNMYPTISNSGYYNKINIANWGHKLIVDTRYGDVSLVVDDLNVSGSIETIGDNKVKIYTHKMIMSGPSINSLSSNKRQVEVYYDGSLEFRVAGSTQFNGSVYTKISDITVSGSGRIFGNIITSGNRVIINGGSMQQDGVIYAPNAEVTLGGSGTVYGAVVGRRTNISGGAIIIYTPDNLDYVPIETDTEIGFINGVRFKRGYYKGGN